MPGGQGPKERRPREKHGARGRGSLTSQRSLKSKSVRSIKSLNVDSQVINLDSEVINVDSQNSCPSCSYAKLIGWSSVTGQPYLKEAPPKGGSLQPWSLKHYSVRQQRVRVQNFSSSPFGQQQPLDSAIKNRISCETQRFLTSH